MTELVTVDFAVSLSPATSTVQRPLGASIVRPLTRVFPGDVPLVMPARNVVPAAPFATNGVAGATKPPYDDPALVDHLNGDDSLVGVQQRVVEFGWRVFVESSGDVADPRAGGIVHRGQPA